VDAAHEIAQFDDCQLGFLVGVGHQLGGALRIATTSEALTRQAELQRQANEALLGAVVEVAFQPPPLVVSGFDDAGAGGADGPRAGP
jgi:hypothetical protein